MNIVGRDKEKKRLEKIFKSKESEFVVVYGRRRIGKTYLIREFFSNKKCNWVHATGVDKANFKTQLTKFTEAISKAFFNEVPLEVPSSWDSLFKLLDKQLDNKPNQKTAIFLDELPWLAAKRSGLLQTIDYYWNHHWSKRKNIILIVCGSSASWMIKNIIYNKGGLHNRVSCEISLQPFSLHEAREFLKYRKVRLNERHILRLYMALGGVPYYLKYVEPGLTADQNVQQILFENGSPLKGEFNKLFQSLFNHSEAYIEIIKLLAKNRYGKSRSELQADAKLSTTGGRLTERLDDLCRAGFIQEHIAWRKEKGEHYTIADEFCLFYLSWIGGVDKRFTKDHWLKQSRSQSYPAWAGYSFESVCFKHVDQLIEALNIKSSGTVESWRFVPRKHTESGAQIDLLIDRSDDAITVCEIKYTDAPFVINKAYALSLENKLAVFKEKTKTQKQIFLAVISANGLKQNVYSEKLVCGVVNLEKLFKGN